MTPVLLRFSPTTEAIPRSAVLVDSNVLVALFSTETPRTEIAHAFIEDLDEPPLVPVAVLVESWGMLAGSKKRPDLAKSLLAWVCTPGKALLLPDDAHDYDAVGRMAAALDIDLVDAILLIIADSISRTSALAPPLSVASFDRRDFQKVKLAGTHRFMLRDLDSDSIY